MYGNLSNKRCEECHTKMRRITQTLFDGNKRHMDVCPKCNPNRLDKIKDAKQRMKYKLK
jgi:hypothetical protein